MARNVLISAVIAATSFVHAVQGNRHGYIELIPVMMSIRSLLITILLSCEIRDWDNMSLSDQLWHAMRVRSRNFDFVVSSDTLCQSGRQKQERARYASPL